MENRGNRFGEAVREGRRAAGHTQEDVAAALNVKQPTISGWENGDTFPTPGNLLRLARFVDLDPVELLELLADEAEVPAA